MDDRLCKKVPQASAGLAKLDGFGKILGVSIENLYIYYRDVVGDKIASFVPHGSTQPPEQLSVSHCQVTIHSTVVVVVVVVVVLFLFSVRILRTHGRAAASFHLSLSLSLSLLAELCGLPLFYTLKVVKRIVSHGMCGWMGWMYVCVLQVEEKRMPSWKLNCGWRVRICASNAGQSNDAELW